MGVINLVTEVGVAVFEQVHNGQNLSVVGNEGFADGVAAGDECLQNLKSNGDDLRVAGVKGG